VVRAPDGASIPGAWMIACYSAVASLNLTFVLRLKPSRAGQADMLSLSCQPRTPPARKRATDQSGSALQDLAAYPVLRNRSGDGLFVAVGYRERTKTER
jgi:hypothetical protein